MSTLPRKYLFIFGFAALAFVLICAAVGAVVLFSGSSGGSVRDLTLRPVDVPQDFVLAEERLFKREELLAQLPAESQVAEKGLKEAIQVTYQSQQGPLVEVKVYSYKDEDAAKAAHRLARNDNPDVLHPVNLKNGMNGYAFNDAQVIDGTGEDSFLMTGIASHDDSDPQTADQSFDVRIYFMHEGNARAEVLVAGSSMFLDPDVVARDQYLRLGSPDAVIVP